MLSRRIFAVLLMLCISAAAYATPTFIGADQITATASTQKPEWAAETFAPVNNLVNGKGFDNTTLTAKENYADTFGYLQRADYGQWLWDVPNAPQPNYSPSGLIGWAWVAFTFNTPQVVDNMWVWNYNRAANPGRDWKTVAIDYTTDGTTWTRLGGSGNWFTFSQSPGTDGYVCNNIINFDGISIKGVCLTLAANYATSATQDYYSGLSEVRFETVPEPVTMLLLGLGGLVLRRRGF